MLNMNGVTNLIKGGLGSAKGWMYSNRYQLLTAASITSGVGAVVYMDVTTEQRAKMIQDKREKVKATENRDLTKFERATADLPLKWEGYAMAGGSALLTGGTIKDLLGKYTAMTAEAALARKQYNELDKAIDNNVSAKEAGKIKKEANTNAAKEAANEGKLASYDAIPSVGRGSTIVLYKPAGIVFRADVNDIRRAYDELSRMASDGLRKGVATREDLIKLLYEIAGGRYDQSQFEMAKDLKLSGWSIWSDGYNGADLDHHVDVENNLDDRDGIYIPADKLGLVNLGMEPILVLDDNAEVIPEEVWKRVYENGYDY